MGEPSDLDDFSSRFPPTEMWSFLGTIDTSTALTVAGLLWPEFIEESGCVLLRARYDEASFKGWWSELSGDRARVEAVVNHTHLWDVLADDQPDQDDVSLLLGIIRQTWQCALRARFPDRRLDVVVETSDEGYGPTITFSTVDQPARCEVRR